MKRFIGWGLVLAGGVATVWGSAAVLRGSSAMARVSLGPDLTISAMTAGLAGVAVLTIGLVWVRD